MAEKLDHGGVPGSDDDGEPYRDLPNFSNLFPSNFSKGLRVLVFDEDPDYLQLLERHLQEFQYRVTICSEEDEAMYLLLNHRSRFDIAMIQVNNSDGDMFRFISEFGSKMDLSIIIISKDDSVQSVIKWMRNGASDYLIKPIRPEDLRIIFKHVVKKIRGRRSVVTLEAGEKAAGEKLSSVGDSTIRNPNKRKRSTCLNAEVNEKDHHDQDRVCAYSSKNKRRIVWDHKLHKKFVDAVNCLGKDKAVPKKILEIMNVEYISRENVASHLQKYRMKKKNDKIKREKMNLSFITQQERRMYVGAYASNFYRGINVQFPTHNINNIPQPSYMQQQTTYPNNVQYPTHNINNIPQPSYMQQQTTYLNNVTAHQHQHHHQTSDFTLAENFGYNNCIEEDSMVANTWPTPEDIGFFPFQEPASFPMRNDHEAGPSSMFHLPSISSDHTHSSFLDQQESGGFDYNNNCSDPETD